MKEGKKIIVEDLAEKSPLLKVRDRILLTGYVYTARDAAHRRFMEMLDAGEALPVPIQGSVIYYAGPTPAREQMVVGSCGPTTAGRMDIYTPRLLDLGLSAMIGKGSRSLRVKEAIKRNKSIYFCALGGAGALYCRRIRSCEEVAFPELGCESVKRFFIEDFPLIVGIDSCGGDIFER